MSYTSESRTYDTLLTSSGNKYMTTVIDNIGKANLMFYLLNQEGFKRTQVGGERIEIPLRMVKSTSGGFYENYDLLNTNPSNPLTKSFYPWKQMHYSVVISRLEEMKNAGETQLVNMLQALFDDAEDAMTQDLNAATFGTPTVASPKPIDGLLNLVPENPNSSTAGRDGDGKIGGIDQVANTWWWNKAKGNGGTGFVWVHDLDSGVVPTAWVAMEELYENCSKGGGPRNKREPNFCIANQIFYRNYLTGLTPQRRYTNSKMAEAGFKNVMFNDMAISWDEDCVSEHGSSSVECAYFLNKNFIHLVVDPNTDFYKTDFVRPANQDAKISQILWYGNYGASSRRKQGVFVDYNITDRT